MNILKLEINDLKRISAIEIDASTGESIILTGDNGQGKSSVLDGILMALSNTGLEDPIRHGRPSASVKITLGADKAEYLLERKITKKGSYLTLTDANGIPVQKAQTFLNGLLGNYAFDPLEFTRLKPKQQVEALKAAAGLDFTELDAKRAEYYAQRTSIGREGKELAAQLAAVPAPADYVPTEEVSATELVEKLQALEKAVRDVEAAKDDEENADFEVQTAERAVKELEDRLAAAKGILLDKQKAKAEAEKRFAELKASAPTYEDVNAARDAISKIDETNRAVRSARKHKELDDKVKKLRAEYATLDRRIEEIDLEKADAVKNAALPIEGLELTDDGVLMGGTFFSQLSTAEQIRVSALVAMAQNPGLRIIIIREGALMNSANLSMLAEMARESGYQLWIERFQESAGQKGLHIVDGAVAAVDGVEV